MRVTFRGRVVCTDLCVVFRLETVEGEPCWQSLNCWSASFANHRYYFDAFWWSVDQARRHLEWREARP